MIPGITPVVEIRALPSSLAQADSGFGATGQAVKLSRPPAGTQLIPLLYRANPPMNVDFQLAKANANRVAVLIRTVSNLPDPPAARIYLKSSPGQINAYPLFHGEDITLEITGELWMVTVPPYQFTGEIFVAEVVSAVAQ